MRIRCGNCHDEFWITLDGAGGRALRVRCPSCSSDYVLHVPDDAAKFKARLAARAVTLVRLGRLDLSSAHSVLLGVMTLDQVPVSDSVSVTPPLQSPPLQPAPDVAPPPPQEASRGMAFDPAFRHAVESGDLTPAQAMQRGMRAQYIDMLAARYRLGRPLAEEVADNRIALMEALRILDPEPDRPQTPRTVGTTSSLAWERWALAAVVGIAVMVAILSARARLIARARPGTPGSRYVWSVRGADVLVDGYGRALKVSAIEPETVLSAYCAVDEPRRYIAVDEIPWEAGDGAQSTRLGLLRRVGHSDELLSIVVREDRESGQWIAGDGINQLNPEPAPSAAAARRGSR